VVNYGIDLKPQALERPARQHLDVSCQNPVKRRQNMRIETDRVVTVAYTLSNEKGEVLDTSKGREPLTYIQGQA
jgi:hypothetical protein